MIAGATTQDSIIVLLLRDKVLAPAEAKPSADCFAFLISLSRWQTNHFCQMVSGCCTITCLSLEKKGENMKELRTEIEIQASPEKVWQTLITLDQYPEWNPFIHHAIGTAKVGEKVDITVRSKPKDLILHCTVVKVEPGKEMRWKYHVIAPALFRGEHIFTIEAAGNNQVHFVDRELFNGLLVPLQAKDIDTNSQKGFEEMDMALKLRAEQS
jgi:hypothetical protein